MSEGGWQFGAKLAGEHQTFCLQTGPREADGPWGPIGLAFRLCDLSQLGPSVSPNVKALQ